MGIRGTIAAVLAGALLVLAACGGDEEELTGTSPTPTPTQTAAPSPDATQTPANPTASIPSDWLTYQDEQGKYTLRYPPGWFKGQFADFFSQDPSKAGDAYDLPAETIEIEVSYSTAAGSDVCGAVLKTDPVTGEALGLLPGVEPATLGGVEGGKLTRTQGDPALDDEFTRIDAIGVVNAGNCVLVTAYYTQQQPDTKPFFLVVASFSFQNPAGR